jgi:hypothetical protein
MLSLALRQQRKTHLDFGPRLDAENKPKRTSFSPSSEIVLAMRRTINALHSSYLIFSPFFLISDGAESCKYCGITAAGTSPPSEGSNTAIV